MSDDAAAGKYAARIRRSERAARAVGTLYAVSMVAALGLAVV